MVGQCVVVWFREEPHDVHRLPIDHKRPLDKESRMSRTKQGIFIFLITIPFPLLHLIVTDIRFRQIFIAPVETVHPKTLESPG